MRSCKHMWFVLFVMFSLALPVLALEDAAPEVPSGNQLSSAVVFQSPSPSPSPIQQSLAMGAMIIAQDRVRADFSPARFYVRAIDANLSQPVQSGQISVQSVSTVIPRMNNESLLQVLKIIPSDDIAPLIQRSRIAFSISLEEVRTRRISEIKLYQQDGAYWREIPLFYVSRTSSEHIIGAYLSDEGLLALTYVGGSAAKTILKSVDPSGSLRPVQTPSPLSDPALMRILTYAGIGILIVVVLYLIQFSIHHRKVRDAEIKDLVGALRVLKLTDEDVRKKLIEHGWTPREFERFLK